MSRYHQGKFIPKNPEKYLGDPNRIDYRSSWEKKCMINFDLSSDIVAWSSEEVVVPYISPKDGQFHRYFPDFIIVTIDGQGKKKISMIEVKPYKEQFPPVKKGKKKSRYLKECLTYEVNQSKWEAAKKYCEKRGWQFVVMTEKHIL